jgi:hypothetical protein
MIYPYKILDLVILIIVRLIKALVFNLVSDLITNLQCQMHTDCHKNIYKFSSFLLLLTFKVLFVNHPFISSSLVIMLRYY